MGIDFNRTFDFEDLYYHIEDDLEKNGIGQELITKLEDCRNYFDDARRKARHADDIMDVVKIFSVADTCHSILNKSLNKLDIARSSGCGENPKSLEDLSSIFFDIIDLGILLSQKNIELAWKKGLDLEEVAEKAKLLEPIEERSKNIPENILKSLEKKLEWELQLN